MNALAVIASVLIGLLRGMRLDDLAAYHWQGTGYVAAALGIKVILGTTWVEANAPVRIAAPLLNLTSMGLLLWTIWLNRRLWGAKLALAGVFLNLIVVLANGGKMPVSLVAVQAAGMPASRIANLVAGRSLTHRLMRPTTMLPSLGDIFILPLPFFRSPVFSLGDIIISISLFILVQELMAYGAARRRAISYFLRQQYELAKLRAAEDELPDNISVETAPGPAPSPAASAPPPDPPGSDRPIA